MQNFPIVSEGKPGILLKGQGGSRQCQPESGFADVLDTGSHQAGCSEPQNSGRGRGAAEHSVRRAPQAQQAEESGRSAPKEASREKPSGLESIGRDDAEQAGLQKTLERLGLTEEDLALVQKLLSGDLRQCTEAQLRRLQEILKQAKSMLKGEKGEGEEFSQLLESLSVKLKKQPSEIPPNPGMARGNPSEQAGRVTDKPSAEADRNVSADAEPGEAAASRKGSRLQQHQGTLEQPAKGAVSPVAAEGSEKGRTDKGTTADRSILDQQPVRSEPQQSAAEHQTGSGSKGQADGDSRQGDGKGNGAWQELWRSIRQEGSEVDRSDAAARKAFQDKADILIQQVMAKSDQQGQIKGEAENRVLRQNVLKQVENGLLRNLGQGKRELTLKLYPPELGSVRVILQVQGKDLQALIKTNSSEAGRMIQQQMSSLQHLFEQQGLKVQKLDVQTFVQQDGSGQQWLGEHGHNQAQQHRDRMEQQAWLSKGSRMDADGLGEPGFEHEDETARTRDTSSRISTVA